MMHDGRDVAATRTDVGDEVRGHDAEAEAALRRHVEQPALDLHQTCRAGAPVTNLRYTLHLLHARDLATSNKGAS